MLQHDCGHHSLLPSGRANDLMGAALSVLTSVPCEAWRTEHRWHHTHQGKLWKRGVDQMNSPMTTDEVPERPAVTRHRSRIIRPLSVFLFGAWVMVIGYKSPKRLSLEPFQRRAHDRSAILWGIAATVMAQLIWQVAAWWLLGWWTSVMVIWPALFLGGGSGSLLFWVQYNFEHTYHDDEGGWHPARVAVEGSSYLRFGPLLRWFTGDIGLHHVHHLNPLIPNYELERARRGIPALRRVEPLDREQLRRSFTHLFWDRHRKVMTPPGDDLE